ncbi:MAG: DUF3556 domain-containing protein [Mycobacteriaceae bacterium]
MRFLKPRPWEFELVEFQTKPRMERLRILAQQWALNGSGMPLAIPLLYLSKISIFYIGIGLNIIGLTSPDCGPIWTFHEWWTNPIVWQKIIVWTILIEVLGLGGAWGPLMAQFRLSPTAASNWLRVGTYKAPPWRWVPLTRGNRRTLFDILAYSALLISLIVLLVSQGQVTVYATQDGAEHFIDLLAPKLLLVTLILLVVNGFRDKLIFLAARGEQYFPALVIFVIFHNSFPDMVIAGKCLIVVVWVGAAISKYGIHFSSVIPVMVSNADWIASKTLKKLNYRSYPEDLRPSKAASFTGHILGTFLELVFPLVLLLTVNKEIAVVGVVAMVAMHIFIISTFPLAAPLEWNVVFIFLAVWLFGMHGSWQGYALYDTSHPYVMSLIIAGLLFFPVLGNFRPDKVSFLPSMRQYAGNWATGLFAFAPGVEEKIGNKFCMAYPLQSEVLAKMYGQAEAATLLDSFLVVRMMHSQGRALMSLMMRNLGEEFEKYEMRDGELWANSLTGWTFGCGHIFNEDLISEIQAQCQLEPGELVVVLIESQPIHRYRQDYRIIDAALGQIESGWFDPRDCVNEQPWLPNGPISVNINQ